jgi:hypothetical protein
MALVGSESKRIQRKNTMAKDSRWSAEPLASEQWPKGQLRKQDIRLDAFGRNDGGVAAGGEKVMKRGLVKRVERLERVQPRDDFNLHFSLGNHSSSARQEGAAIDLVELEKLCMLHCRDQEIASYFGVTAQRIEQERKSPPFAEVMERGKAKGKIAIRRGQMRLLEKGSSTMAVLLGKQILGQRDEVEATNQPIAVVVMPCADSEEGEI